MALAMKEFTITFPSGTGTPARLTQTVSFPTNVRTAQAVLKGFEARQVNADREFHVLHVDIDVVSISANDVEIAGDLELRDLPNPVDQFKGFIQGVVIADLV